MHCVVARLAMKRLSAGGIPHPAPVGVHARCPACVISHRTSNHTHGLDLAHPCAPRARRQPFHRIRPINYDPASRRCRPIADLRSPDTWPPHPSIHAPCAHNALLRRSSTRRGLPCFLHRSEHCLPVASSKTSAGIAHRAFVTPPPKGFVLRGVIRMSFK